jgi:hypothetical protein
MKPFGISNGDRNSNSSFYVRSSLCRLDFKSFQRVVWLWLGASGYRNLRTLSRGKQRGRGAVGPDFLVQVGDDGFEVAVQIRHWKSPLTKRAVDELRGGLLRDAIPAGMIVCPAQISRAARSAAASYPGRPIRLIGLERLADSLTALELDDSAFFRTIGAMSLGVPVGVGPSHRRKRSIDLVTTPDGPQHVGLDLILAGVLLILLILWVVKGLG